MPDFAKKPNGDVDYGKLFMGFAVAFVYVLQAWHAMQLSDVKAEVVPRSEYETKHAQLMQKDVILDALNKLSDRMDAMEKPNVD